MFPLVSYKSAQTKLVDALLEHRKFPAQITHVKFFLWAFFGHLGVFYRSIMMLSSIFAWAHFLSARDINGSWVLEGSPAFPIAFPVPIAVHMSQ
jgi:hypothetical protein